MARKNFKGRAKPISQKSVHAYCARVLGYSLGHGVSLHDIACRALAQDGMPRPEGRSLRSWVYECADFIRRKNQGQQVDLLAAKLEAAKLPVTNVIGDAFLSTYEWRRVRMVALKKYGARCQCCGASPAEGAVMNVDHIKPRRLFPALALDVDNLQVLCHDCNHGKGNWDMTDWRPEEVALDDDASSHMRAIAAG